MSEDAGRVSGSGGSADLSELVVGRTGEKDAERSKEY